MVGDHAMGRVDTCEPELIAGPPQRSRNSRPATSVNMRQVAHRFELAMTPITVIQLLRALASPLRR